jgi:hypothetical protein
VPGSRYGSRRCDRERSLGQPDAKQLACGDGYAAFEDAYEYEEGATYVVGWLGGDQGLDDEAGVELLWENNPDAAWRAATEGGCTRNLWLQDDYEGYLEEIRRSHRPKRNLMKLMDQIKTRPRACA